MGTKSISVSPVATVERKRLNTTLPYDVALFTPKNDSQFLVPAIGCWLIQQHCFRYLYAWRNSSRTEPFPLPRSNQQALQRNSPYHSRQRSDLFPTLWNRLSVDFSHCASTIPSSADGRTDYHCLVHYPLCSCMHLLRDDVIRLYDLTRVADADFRVHFCSAPIHFRCELA